MNTSERNAVDILTMWEAYMIYTYQETFEEVFLGTVLKGLEGVNRRIKRTEASGTFQHVVDNLYRDQDAFLSALDYYNKHRYLLQRRDNG